jgi:hypothetical protein
MPVGTPPLPTVEARGGGDFVIGNPAARLGAGVRRDIPACSAAREQGALQQNVNGCYLEGSFGNSHLASEVRRRRCDGD